MRRANHGQARVIDALALEDNQVYVHIGPEAEKYAFYKNILREDSPVLSDRMNQCEVIIDLKEWPRSSFRIYASWAFAGRLPEDHDEWWSLINQGAQTRDLCLLERLQACVFGREMGMLEFANECYNSFVTAAHASKLPPSNEIIAYAFENISENEQLLEFLVDMYVFNTRMTRSQASGGGSSGITKNTGTHPVTRSQTSTKAVARGALPEDFVSRMMEKNMEMAQGTFAGVKHACAYHIHACDEDRDHCPSHILSTKGTPFRVFGHAIIMVLAEMGKKTTHGLAGAVLRVVELVAGPVIYNNGHLYPDYEVEELSPAHFATVASETGLQ